MVCQAMPDAGGVSLDQFLAYQHFFENIDVLKSKVNQYRFIDYLTFQEIIDTFNKTNPYCVRNKTGISEDMAKALFLYFDQDESGEIEPEEISMFEKPMFGVSQEEKQKQEALDFAKAKVKAARKWFADVTGYKI